MLADPQSVIINTTTLSLPAIARSETSSTYRVQDATYGDVKFTVSHQYKSRSRISARVDLTKFVTNYGDANNTFPLSASCYVVVDSLSAYTTDAERSYYLKALANWLLAGTNALSIAGGQT